MSPYRRNARPLDLSKPALADYDPGPAEKLGRHAVAGNVGWSSKLAERFIANLYPNIVWGMVVLESRRQTELSGMVARAGSIAVRTWTDQEAEAAPSLWTFIFRYVDEIARELEGDE